MHFTHVVMEITLVMWSLRVQTKLKTKNRRGMIDTRISAQCGTSHGLASVVKKVAKKTKEGEKSVCRPPTGRNCGACGMDGPPGPAVSASHSSSPKGGISDGRDVDRTDDGVDADRTKAKAKQIPRSLKPLE